MTLARRRVTAPIWSALTVLSVTAGARAQTQPPYDGVKPFEAIGTIDPTSVAVNIVCPDGSPGTRMTGSLRGTDIGTGTYTLCVDAPSGPHQPWSPGTLTFTRDDGVSMLMVKIALMRLSNYQATATYLGTYDLDPATPPTGTFVGHLTGGPGLLELSQPSRVVFLNGVIKSP
jgi:hypothetical protein